MNAVALQGKSDPSSSDWIVRPWRKNQLIGNALLLRNKSEDFGIEGVVGVGGNICYGEG